MIGLVTQEGTYALLRGRLLCGVFQKVGSVGSSSGFGDGPLLQVQKVHRKLGSRRRNRDELKVVAGRAAALTEGTVGAQHTQVQVWDGHPHSDRR